MGNRKEIELEISFNSKCIQSNLMEEASGLQRQRSFLSEPLMLAYLLMDCDDAFLGSSDAASLASCLIWVNHINRSRSEVKL